MNRLLFATLLLAFGAGVLALILFWLALLGVGWTTVRIGAIWLAAMVGIGLLLWRIIQQEAVGTQYIASIEKAENGSGRYIYRPYEIAILAVIVLIAVAALFNGAYFPFSHDDALGIYRPAALAMWQTGTLEPLIGAESLYRTYPILVPLNYTFAYIISGWENEYLAKTIATLLSLGCLPASYLLGREVGGRRVGLLAALSLALTPSFVRWSSAGYVDLPMAFYYTLSVLFALRFWRGGRISDAALAGAMMGFAAFTKNAGLIGVPLLALWLVAAVGRGLNRQGAEVAKKRDSWRLGVLAVVVALVLCAGIAAPFYIRNLIGAGFLMPDTAWTDQAERTLRTLLIFITLPDNFLISGWLILAGIGFAAWRAVRHVISSGQITADDPQGRPYELRDAYGYAAILWFTVPFFAAWWVFVSYDPRFLLLYYPILCIGAAVFVDYLLDRITVGTRSTSSVRLLAQSAVYIAVIAVALYCLWIAVEFKDEILHNPLMSHEEKIALVRDTP